MNLQVRSTDCEKVTMYFNLTILVMHALSGGISVPFKILDA